MARISFNVVRDHDGQIAKMYPFWIGTALGMVFVLFAFLVAVVDITREKRLHDATINSLTEEPGMEQIVKGGVQMNGSVHAAFETPASGTVMGMAEVRLSLTPADAQTKFVRIFIDGSDAAVFSQGPFVYMWDTANVKNGRHVLSAMAVDANGLSTLVQHAVTVENAQ